MCGSIVDIQYPTAEIRRGKKQEERKIDRNHNCKRECLHLLRRAAIRKIVTTGRKYWAAIKVGQIQFGRGFQKYVLLVLAILNIFVDTTV